MSADRKAPVQDLGRVLDGTGCRANSPASASAASAARCSKSLLSMRASDRSVSVILLPPRLSPVADSLAHSPGNTSASIRTRQAHPPSRYATGRRAKAAKPELRIAESVPIRLPYRWSLRRA